MEFKIEYPVGSLDANQIVAAFQDAHGHVGEPTHVVALGQGKFAVRFTPKKPGKYTTKVSIKGAGTSSFTRDKTAEKSLTFTGTMDGQLEIDAQNAPGIQLIEGASGLATVGKPFTFKLSAPEIKVRRKKKENLRSDCRRNSERIDN